MRGETDGVAVVSGDPDRRTFIVEVSGGAALDQFGKVLAAEGYPLGDVASEQPDAHGSKSPDWTPDAYRAERTDVGANVNYECTAGATRA